MDHAGTAAAALEERPRMEVGIEDAMGAATTLLGSPGSTEDFGYVPLQFHKDLALP
jgi:hypothetical protein